VAARSEALALKTNLMYFVLKLYICFLQLYPLLYLADSELLLNKSTEIFTLFLASGVSFRGGSVKSRYGHWLGERGGG
jgi:hypothetical protein